uniref:Uncharacterized protein n=1 Tax=Arundo donax TaxID=35708 RepID=A0A0A9FUX1_ARUDO
MVQHQVVTKSGYLWAMLLLKVKEGNM